MHVLFLGEGSLHGPARYLASALRWSGISFDHQPDLAPLPAVWHKRRYDAILLSDYRYSSWRASGRRWFIEKIKNGTGLFMIGGWASFTGLVGHYSGTDLETLLPVRCLPQDDRVNRSAVLTTEGLRSPIVVNGYHRSRAKTGSRVHGEFHDLEFKAGKPYLGKRHPALVSGHFGRGRTLAFLTDVAPHWAGGLVDAGKQRVAITLKKDTHVEVGSEYLRFLKRWTLWTCGA